VACPPGRLQRSLPGGLVGPLIGRPGRRAEPERLETLVRRFAGERHPETSPGALERALEQVAEGLESAGCRVRWSPFRYRGRTRHNVVGRRDDDATGPAVLIGAHVDTVPGTPGADDNASGLAVLLEVARLLSAETFTAPLEFVGFDLEEPRGTEYAVGSDRYAGQARREGREYRACFILEMVGYTDATPGCQSVPPLLFWKNVPKAGTFLAAVGDWQSRRLVDRYLRSARSAAPELSVVGFRSPFRGRLVPPTRLSDNCRFWDRGYPALMLTDTAFLRNPHYHGPGDRPETLDYRFMARVADATAAAVRSLAG